MEENMGATLGGKAMSLWGSGMKNAKGKI